MLIKMFSFILSTHSAPLLLNCLYCALKRSSICTCMRQHLSSHHSYAQSSMSSWQHSLWVRLYLINKQTKRTMENVCPIENISVIVRSTTCCVIKSLSWIIIQIIKSLSLSRIFLKLFLKYVILELFIHSSLKSWMYGAIALKIVRRWTNRTSLTEPQQ